MWKVMLKWFKKPIKKWILSKVNDEELQKELIEKANKKIDLPKLPEEEEAKFLNSMYDTAQELINAYVDSIFEEL